MDSYILQILDNDEEFSEVSTTPETDFDAMELELLKEASATKTRITKEDLDRKRESEKKMLQDFKKDPGSHTFMPLYNSLKPAVIKAASSNMIGSQISPAAHMALAAQSFYDATRTYDPGKGSFSNHMFTTVREKGKRLNLKFQNVGYIPETRATKYQNYKNAVYMLKEELGREPSDIEIADESGISVREIENMRKEVTKDLIGREHYIHKGMTFAQSDKAMQVARDIYYLLEPKHQLVLEYMVGLNGKPSLTKPSGKSDIPAIAKASGLKTSDVRSARKTIKRKFMEYKSYLGKSDESSPFFDESED